MAFVAPSRNLLANYWRNATWTASWLSGTGVVPPPDLVVNVQLRAPKTGDPYGALQTWPLMEVIFESGEDVRPPVFSTNEYYYWVDMVEVPAASGCYYFVAQVFDVAKGFLNEYRVAFAVPTWGLEGALYSGLAHHPYAPAWPRPFP